MEIRSTTIAYTKHKAKLSRDRLLEIRRQLEQLSGRHPAIISFLLILTKSCNFTMILKPNLSPSTKTKENKLCSGRNVDGWRMENGQLSSFLTTIKRPSLNSGYKITPQHAMKSRSLIKLKITLKNYIHPKRLPLKRNAMILSNICKSQDFRMKIAIVWKALDLTEEECKKVLESFQNDKSPGEDGFTVEFYKFFYADLLGKDLLASFNEAYETNV